MTTNHLTLLAIIMTAGLAEANPPPEVAQLAKSMSGTWKCGKTTIKSVTEVGGVWLHDTYTGEVQREAFTTFDPAAKKWRRVVLTADGTALVGTSDGMKDMKIDWDYGAVKEHVDASDLKKGLRITADKLDLTCRR